MAFFDKVGASLSKMGNDVSSKTKSMVEVTNLNGQLKSSESQLKEIYVEVGKAYYKANKNKDVDEEMQKLFDQVAEAEEAIVHLKSLLHKAKGTVECSNCHAEMPFGTLFCSACGAKIGVPEVTEEEAEAEKIECPKCHTELKAGAAFCASCGTKIEKAE